MSNLYHSLAELCKTRGITGYKMCKDVGIQPSIITDLKMGRRTGVKAETAHKIATYFGVTVGYLLGDRQNTPDANPHAKEEPPALSEELQKLIDDYSCLDAHRRKLLQNYLAEQVWLAREQARYARERARLAAKYKAAAADTIKIL